MSNRGPVITLFAVAALAVVLVGFNVTTISQTAAPAPVPADAQAPNGTNGAPAQPPQAAPEQAAPEQAAPQQVEAAQQATYAGRTSGNEATIAIAVRNDQATAYVCDGRRVEEWLQGTVENGRFTAQGTGDDQATGTVEGNAVFGTVSVNGAQWPYSAQLASPPAGLYQGSGTVNGTSDRIGWIVLQDGSQVGVWTRNGIPRPAPRLDPEALRSVTVDGARIYPRRVSGGTRIIGGTG